jgi:ubiquinone/menaquinone biosynthesis C-methylase UbiE
MEQPYISRILDGRNEDFEQAFQRAGHMHVGYYGDSAFRDTSAQTYAAASDVLAQRVFAAARIADGMRVLDIGCGLGGSIEKLNEERTGVDLVGVNIEPRQLDLARARIQALPTNRVSFVEGDASHLPFADASFDALISIECVEHLPSRRQFFREARRVLRPGGRFTLTDYIARARALPFLAVLAPFLQPRLKSFYGDFNSWPCPVLGFHLLGRSTGLRGVQNDDLTRNVQPTFAALKKIFNEHEASRAIDTVAWFCRTGMVRYRVMTFA